MNSNLPSTHTIQNKHKPNSFPPLTMQTLLLFLQNNLLAHAIYNLAIELGRLAPWETNLLGKIIRQQV
jgi:hypothetical protein